MRYQLARNAFALTSIVLAGACGHHARTSPAETALPECVVDTAGSHWVRIDRRVPSERRFALVAAERHQPIADSVARAIAHSASFTRHTPYQHGQWWYDGFDNVHVPYAVTGEAVRYYLDLSETFKRNGGRGASSAPPMSSTSLSYIVTVTRADSIVSDAGRPATGYVVEMTLGWSQWCGTMCAMRFQKKRRVWVSPDGRVTAVEGDGLTRFMVR